MATPGPIPCTLLSMVSRYRVKTNTFSWLLQAQEWVDDLSTCIFTQTYYLIFSHVPIPSLPVPRLINLIRANFATR